MSTLTCSTSQGAGVEEWVFFSNDSFPADNLKAVSLAKNQSIAVIKIAVSYARK